MHNHIFIFEFRLFILQSINMLKLLFKGSLEQNTNTNNAFKLLKEKYSTPCIKMVKLDLKTEMHRISVKAGCLIFHPLFV